MEPDQPEADVLDQQHPDDEDAAHADVVADPGALPLEADAADVAEQRTIVPQDVDEP